MDQDGKANWIEELKELRRRKEVFFKEDPRSPIAHEKRKNFAGLKYYPINPKYRLILPLNEHKDKEILKIPDTAGYEGGYIRWGEFRFEIDEKVHITSLQG